MSPMKRLSTTLALIAALAAISAAQTEARIHCFLDWKNQLCWVHQQSSWCEIPCLHNGSSLAASRSGTSISPSQHSDSHDYLEGLMRNVERETVRTANSADTEVGEFISGYLEKLSEIW